MTSCSFRNAMIDPEKLTAPMIAERTSETATTTLMLDASFAAMKNATVEMSAAAPPPAPL